MISKHFKSQVTKLYDASAHARSREQSLLPNSAKRLHRKMKVTLTPRRVAENNFDVMIKHKYAPKMNGPKIKPKMSTAIERNRSALVYPLKSTFSVVWFLGFYTE
jgi:hypothetical protein